MPLLMSFISKTPPQAGRQAFDSIRLLNCPPEQAKNEILATPSKPAVPLNPEPLLDQLSKSSASTGEKNRLLTYHWAGIAPDGAEECKQDSSRVRIICCRIDDWTEH